MQQYIRVFILLVAFITLPPTPQAQEFPAKPVRLLVPFPPGGPLDVTGRLIAANLGERWGQNVLVENRPGGTIANEFVARSAPDGYTLMIISSTPMVTLPLMQKVPYDPVKSYTSVIQTATIAYAMMAHPSTGFGNVRDLVEAAKKSPGKLNFSTGGAGSGQHLYVEMFKLAAGGLEITQIPYKGAGPALQALIAGEVHLMLDVLSGAIPTVNGGKARALFVTGKPVEQLRGVPTFDSLYPGLEISSWHGIFAPANMPRSLTDKIATDIRATLNTPAVGNRMRDLGFEVTGIAGEAFAEIVRSDYGKWAEVIRRNNLRIDP